MVNLLRMATLICSSVTCRCRAIIRLNDIGLVFHLNKVSLKLAAAQHGNCRSGADSERLNNLCCSVLAELRLAFGLLRDPEFLHPPYVETNAKILAMTEAGSLTRAFAALNHSATIWFIQSALCWRCTRGTLAIPAGRSDVHV